MKKQAQDMLARIAPFWQGLADKEYGGFYGYMDFDLRIDRQADKGCILNSRILWFFSKAYLALKTPALLESARHAYDFLMNHCIDSQQGGVYWSLRYDGSPSDTTKHTYNQAFAIYALSAYYQAGGEARALEAARALYEMIEQRCLLPESYGEAYDRAFQPVENDKLSENGVVATHTMNTLLHVFEGYAGLYEAAPDPRVADSLRHILAIFERQVYNPALRRQEVFFDAQMHSLLDLHSYGHDIESAWLLDWGTALLGDSALSTRIAAMTSALAQQVYEAAYHKHSLWNECEEGQPDRTRVWWVQAEAVVGFLNHARKHPAHAEYLQAARDTLQYIEAVMIDPRPGSEWYWEVDDSSAPNRQKPIVEPWKCPYHNGRMCLEIIKRSED